MNAGTPRGRLAAAYNLAAMDPDMWHDNATHFNCAEADAIAAFLRAFTREATADTFLRCHADGDDDGDQHHPDGTARPPLDEPAADSPRTQLAEPRAITDTADIPALRTDADLIGKTITGLEPVTVSGAYGPEPALVVRFADGSAHTFVSPQPEN